MNPAASRSEYVLSWLLTFGSYEIEPRTPSEGAARRWLRVEDSFKLHMGL